jgi:iron complex outermembrane recepter protein
VSRQTRLLLRTAALSILGLPLWLSAAQADQNFDLPAQPLSRSLQAVAKLAGTQLIYSEHLVAGKRAPELHGVLDLDEALRQLLAGTNLLAERTPGGSIQIRLAASAELRPGPVNGAVQRASLTLTQGQAALRSLALEEIIVTATRRAEALSDIAVSVVAMTIEQLERRGVKNFDDIVRYTPGLTLTRANNGANQISIRGISSQAGSATTGVYIDDVAIQVRNLDYSAGTLFPTIFDLERIEVLRGPQGTLFGAGSEGGTVRFIQPEPSLAQHSGYFRAEVNTINNGGSGYEVGWAHGGPIIEGKLGFRASAFFKHEAGYIDRVTGTPSFHVADGSAGPASTSYEITGTPYANSNWDDTVALRGALKAGLSDDFTATLSMSFQDRYLHDGTGSFWASASNAGGADFVSPIYFAGSATTNPNLSPMEGLPNIDKGGEKFLLPALTLSYDNGSIGVTSITGHFDRDSNRYMDSTRGYGRAYAGIMYPRPGDKSVYYYRDYQKNWSQEVRVQSVDGGSLQWLAGVFYARMKQVSNQEAFNNFIQKTTVFNTPADGAPFGPGYSSFINYFGAPALPNSVIYSVLSQVNDKQLAGFGELTYEIMNRLKVTGGARYSSNRTHFASVYGAPENLLNAPLGRACIPNSNPCVPVAIGQYRPGEGPFAPQYAVGDVSGRESILTPKFSVSYDMTDAAILYGTVAKGYRQGGGQIKVPGVCNDQLVLLGYADAAGNADQPLSFDSDSVWNYEIGTKSALFGGRLYVDGSAYYIKWNNIQQRISVPVCAYAFVDNLVSATSRGFDIAVNFKPAEGITLGTAIGYNKPTIDTTIPAPTGGMPLFYEGQYILNSGAPWSVHLYGQYDFFVASDRMAYVRVDYTFSSSLYAAAARDPRSRLYTSPLGRVPETHLINARVGTTISDVVVSLFANNLLDASPSLNLQHARNDPVWTDATFRPRTVGMTASYRY